MYTGVCWIEALNGTLAIQEMGTQEGCADGYYTLPYKLETNSRAETRTSLLCPDSLTAVEVTASNDWLAVFPKLQVSYIKYLDMS